jgi:hypothetical protein
MPVMTAQHAALRHLDVLYSRADRARVGLGFLGVKPGRTRLDLVELAGSIEDAARILAALVWSGDRSIEPDDWTMQAPTEPGGEWVCVRHDDRLAAFGATREAAVAATWIEVDRRDLHAIGARMAVAQLGLRNAHGDGVVRVMATRQGPPDDPASWEVFIVASFGVNHTALRQVEDENEDGDFGLTFPDCEQCEALCRIVYEDAECDEFGRVCVPAISYLEIIDIDGKPAIEVCT